MRVVAFFLLTHAWSRMNEINEETLACQPVFSLKVALISATFLTEKIRNFDTRANPPVKTKFLLFLFFDWRVCACVKIPYFFSQKHGRN